MGIRIIDTYPQISSVYDPLFDPEKWERYADAISPELRAMCIRDRDACIAGGELSWEKDYLPVLNAAAAEKELREEAHASFLALTESLEDRITECFGRAPDVDILLYLGLCNGAGWVTKLDGRDAILLGLEKITELRWCGLPDMTGLIFHELGHAYQAQFGILERDHKASEDRFLWQLFTEGVAMVFEQEILGDPDYYHQDRDGWKAWCGCHLPEMKRDFAKDLPEMRFETQRWFGDWVFYQGRPDAGYYLGARFVRNILARHSFDEIIRFDIRQVREEFSRFSADE